MLLRLIPYIRSPLHYELRFWLFYNTLRFGQTELVLLRLIPYIRSPLHYELRFW